jgi:hypothetical protein
LNGDAFCTTTDLWKEKYTGKSYMSVTVHHIDADWNNLSSFIWSTTEYNLEDHRAPSIYMGYFIPVEISIPVYVNRDEIQPGLKFFPCNRKIHFILNL